LVAAIEALGAQLEHARALRRQTAAEVDALLTSALERLFPENRNNHFQYQYVRDAIEDHKQGYYAKGKPAEGSVYYARITDISDDGYLNYSSMPRIDISSDLLRRFRVRPNDFLFARTGGAGRFGVATQDVDCVFASYLIRFTFKSDYTPEFLRYYLRSPQFQNHIRSSIHGGVNQNVHAEDIKSATIPIISAIEQEKIVSQLASLQMQLDNLRRLQTETSAGLDAMMPSILDRAFSGEL
jgi:type I restriction enzyme S subunit